MKAVLTAAISLVALCPGLTSVIAQKKQAEQKKVAVKAPAQNAKKKSDQKKKRADPKKTVIQRVFEAFADRRRERANRVEKVAVPMRPARPPKVIPPGLKKERRKRLAAYTGAVLGWVAAETDATEKQRVLLTKLTEAQLETEQKLWVEGKHPRSTTVAFSNTQNGDLDFIPFEFAIAARRMTSGNAWKSGLDDIFDEPQLEKLRLAIQARDDNNRDRLAGFAMSILDRELFLNPTQASAVSQDLKNAMGDKIFTGLYSFMQNQWPYVRVQFKATPDMKKHLGDVRYKRFQRMVKSNGQDDRYLMVRMQNGVENTFLTDAVTAQRKRLSEALDIRIEFLDDSVGLTDPERRKLKLAGKGASTRVLDKWVEASKKQMESMRKRFANQNVSWALNLPQIAEIDKNVIWTKTQERILAGHAGNKSVVADRVKARRRTTIEYVTAVIDQEIWLHENQRTAFAQLADAAIEDLAKYERNWQYYLEMQLLIDVLYGADEKKMAALLNEPQLASWNSLRNQFRLENGLAAMTYRHGEIRFSVISPTVRRKSRLPEKDR